MKFCAHIRENDNCEQTVYDHCLETAELARKYGTNIGCEHIAYILGILHDIGKLTPEFNDYIHGDAKYRKGDLDHSYTGARYICAVCERMGQAYDELARFIAHIIVSHHGLHDWVEFDGRDYLQVRIDKDEGYESVIEHVKMIISDDELVDLVRNARNEYLAICDLLKNIAACSKYSGNAFAFYLGLFERTLQSILIDADRTNTAEFMYDKRIEHEYDVEALFQQMQKTLEEKNEAFSRKKDKVSVQRCSISARCKSFAKNDVGICQLVVPTGGGKTLSSLRFAIEYCVRNGMERIMYVAPYMSILEQNSSEIGNIVGKENEDAFLEHYTNAMQDIESAEELERYELFTEKWNTPVIATTMVQFLNTLFSGKSSSIRRMHRLSRAVIIIDEVQSIPIKCVNMFNLAMNYLKTVCDSTIVLCSATQPDFTNSDYPILLDNNSSMTGKYEEDFYVLRRTEVTSCMKPYGYTLAEAAEFCYKKYALHHSLLVVVNTKDSALKMYSLLKEINKNEEEERKAIVIHLSTSMCPKHRKDTIEKMRKMLKQSERVICVTTQLIEAGVDISFGSVVRFLAGLDNIVQAAGRCNRHGEQNGLSPVYVINMRDGEEKLGKLQEIKRAQSIARTFIGNPRVKDFLSAETMTKFYRKVYKDVCDDEPNALSYKTEDDGVSVTLVDLLSLNKARWNIKGDEKIKYSAQAFKTAGRLFEVIEKNTIDILVPYDDTARNIIARLSSDFIGGEQDELLRKAQPYMVSVYPGPNKKLLDQQATYQLPCGVHVLKENYYDLEQGIVIEGAEQEVLVY